MEWNVGDMVSKRWEVRRVLRGGMGIVYIVYDHHPEFRHLFAAKTFQDKTIQRHTGLFDAFRREANVWVGLNAHPNIVRAHYIRDIAGKPYLFLEYVDGGDLSHYIGSPALQGNISMVLRLALQFCAGMIHASAQGLSVHRDIKPQNCLLARGTILKITDFGLAKTLAAPRDLRFPNTGTNLNVNVSTTQTGMSMGTPTHMAPEQFDDAKRVDVRADVYSFGIVLYQMVSGTLPFMARTWGELKDMHQGTAVPHIPNAPSALRQILMRCLAKDSRDRFAGFSAVHDALAECHKVLVGTSAPPQMRGKELNAFELCNKGASLASLGFHARAMEIYTQAVDLWSADTNTWINMGASLHELGRFTEAISCYAKAIELDHTAAGAWLNRGLTHLRLDQRGHAKRCFMKAVEFGPSLQQAWVELGKLHAAAHEHGAADRYFETALQIDPLDIGTLEAFGNFLVEMQHAKRALELYESVLRVYGRVESLWLNRGVALEELGRFQEALLSYVHATNLNAKSSKAWAYQGNALFKLNRIDQAISTYARAIDLDPADAQTWVNQGICLAESERVRDALQCFEKARELGHPGGPELIAKCRLHLAR